MRFSTCYSNTLQSLQPKLHFWLLHGACSWVPNFQWCEAWEGLAVLRSLKLESLLLPSLSLLLTWRSPARRPWEPHVRVSWALMEEPRPPRYCLEENSADQKHLLRITERQKWTSAVLESLYTLEFVRKSSHSLVYKSTCKTCSNILEKYSFPPITSPLPSRQSIAWNHFSTQCFNTMSPNSSSGSFFPNNINFFHLY